MIQQLIEQGKEKKEQPLHVISISKQDININSFIFSFWLIFNRRNTIKKIRDELKDLHFVVPDDKIGDEKSAIATKKYTNFSSLGRAQYSIYQDVRTGEIITGHNYKNDNNDVQLDVYDENNANIHINNVEKIIPFGQLPADLRQSAYNFEMTFEDLEVAVSNFINNKPQSKDRNEEGNSSSVIVKA